MIEKMVIGREAYEKIMYYVHKTDFEISGLGNVRVIDGIPTVTDIILLEQENCAVETEIEGSAIAKAIYDHHVSGMEGDLKFWWHSHVNMGVFWSSTDKATIKELTKEGWFIHGVFNKKNEYKCAYSNIDPVSVFVDNLKLEIDNDMISNERLIELSFEQDKLDKEYDRIAGDIEDEEQKELGLLCDAKFDELVTVKTYQPTYNTGSYYSNPNSWRDHFKGKQTGSQTMGNSHQALTTQDFGAGSTTKDFFYFQARAMKDPEGAMELSALGYTDNELEHLQTFLWIEAAMDLEWYEHTYGLGSVKEDLASAMTPVITA